MIADCATCREIDRTWRIDEDSRMDLAFRRRRRALFHVQFCMTLEEKAEWLEAGGMSLIRKLGE